MQNSVQNAFETSLEGGAAWADTQEFVYWPHPDQTPNRYLPDPVLHWPLKAQISPYAKVATMGSCFARNVELAFKRMGFDVISTFVPGLPYSENITNKYVVGSMIQDVDVLSSSDGLQGFDADYVLTDDEEHLVSLTLGGSGAFIPRTRPELDDLMRRYFANLSHLRTADLVFLFLENTEEWRDRLTGRTVNIQPSRELCAKHQGRFEVVQIGLDDMLARTRALIARLRECLAPTARIFVGVSPVPPARCFTGRDVMIEYGRTKSILRLVAEEVSQDDSRTEFLPIYERLTLVAPERRWIPQDYRHFQYPEVELALRSLLTANLSHGAFAPDKQELLKLFQEKNFAELARRVEAMLEAQRGLGKTIHDQGNQIRYYYGLALMNLARTDEALDVLSRFVAENPNHPAATVFLARLQIKKGQSDVALQAVQHILALQPDYLPAQRLRDSLQASDNGTFSDRT